MVKLDSRLVLPKSCGMEAVVEQMAASIDIITYIYLEVAIPIYGVGLAWDSVQRQQEVRT